MNDGPLSKCEWDELRAWRNIPQDTTRREDALFHKGYCVDRAMLDRIEEQARAVRGGVGLRREKTGLNGEPLDE